MYIDEVFYAPKVKWQYTYIVIIDGYEYQFGDRVPMSKTLEDAQRVMTYAVETHSNIPVNILGALTGKFISKTQFEGKVWFADDNEDGIDVDESSKRIVDVYISCNQMRSDTVYGD